MDCIPKGYGNIYKDFKDVEVMESKKCQDPYTFI